jgi:hypothetical protein
MTYKSGPATQEKQGKAQKMTISNTREYSYRVGCKVAFEEMTRPRYKAKTTSTRDNTYTVYSNVAFEGI